MKKQFKGRPVLAGRVSGEAVVSHTGFNTLAAFQKSMLTHRRKAICSDQGNADLFGKNITGKVLCIPQTIGSTSGGLAFQTAVSLGIAPKAILFSEHIDSLAASGMILSDIWQGKRIVTVDLLGPDFLAAVRDGNRVEIFEDGRVEIS
ncbi:MAG: DUF126 domain-containing protein [Myxococcota bacterium]|jgi:predicted aconitase with swiveling domain